MRRRVSQHYSPRERLAASHKYIWTDLRHIFFKGINILGSTQGTRAELEQGLYWMSQGKIKSTIDSVYSLEQAAEAHTKMLIGKGLFGKILIKPES